MIGFIDPRGGKSCEKQAHGIPRDRGAADGNPRQDRPTRTRSLRHEGMEARRGRPNSGPCAFGTIMHMRGRWRSTRRGATRAAVFLLLGAIINVTVAWIHECRAYPKNVIDEAITDDDAKSAMPIRWAPMDAPLITVTGSRRVVPGRTEYVLFAFHHEITSEGSIRYANQLSVWNTGWPCRSMQGWTGIGRTPSEIGSHGSWRVKWTFASESSGVRQHGLPLLPLWPGFAINTLFYAAI